VTPVYRFSAHGRRDSHRFAAGKRATFHTSPQVAQRQ